jgi:uncharacterized membrane protein
MALFLFSIVAALAFLAGDFVVIPLVMRPLFVSALGASMLDDLRLAPALAFYLIHVAGIVWFAGRPYLRDGNRTMAFVNGAALGFVAYSCYEMTSWTIMRDWHSGLVIIDLGWGTLISGLSALAGAYAASWRRPIQVQ